MTDSAINLAEKLATFSDHWSPKIVSAFADEEVEILLIEPAGTPNTGDPATAAEKVVI